MFCTIGINKYLLKERLSESKLLPLTEHTWVKFTSSSFISHLAFYLFLMLLYSSNGKESASNAGDQDSFPGLGKSSGEGNGNPLQYSCLENPWWATVHGVAKSRPRLTNIIKKIKKKKKIARAKIICQSLCLFLRKQTLVHNAAPYFQMISSKKLFLEDYLSSCALRPPIQAPLSRVACLVALLPPPHPRSMVSTTLFHGVMLQTTTEHS